MPAYTLVNRVLNSPNQESGRNKYETPRAIVMHVMAGTLTGCDSWFLTSESGVSAHYGVGTSEGNLEIHQYVDPANTAWHVGGNAHGTWDFLGGLPHYDPDKPNYYTLGVEMEGAKGSEITSQVIDRAALLVAHTCLDWGIPIDREHIVGHCEINSVSRSECPGIDLDKFVKLVNEKYVSITSQNAIEETENTDSTIKPPTNVIEVPQPEKQPNLLFNTISMSQLLPFLMQLAENATSRKFVTTLLVDGGAFYLVYNKIVTSDIGISALVFLVAVVTGFYFHYNVEQKFVE